MLTNTLCKSFYSVIHFVSWVGHALGQQASIAGNPYQSWIDRYQREAFQTAAKGTTACLDELCHNASVAQATKLQHIFNTATRMEVAFWQMGLDCS